MIYFQNKNKNLRCLKNDNFATLNASKATPTGTGIKIKRHKIRKGMK